MRVCKIFGTEVILDTSWFVFVFLLSGMSAVGPDGFSPLKALVTLGVLLILFVCVLGHEFAHIWAGNQLGIKVPKVILHVFGGAAMFPTIPYGKREIYIAVMGPLFSLVLAGTFFALEFLCPTGSILLSVVSTVCYINVLLGGFNLFPIFPMDGGRIARGIFYLCMRRNVVKSTKTAVYLGWCLTPVLVWLIGINLCTIIVLGFIVLLGLGELRSVTHANR